MRREHEQITTDYNKMIIKLEEIVKRHEKLQEEFTWNVMANKSCRRENIGVSKEEQLDR